MNKVVQTCEVILLERALGAQWLLLKLLETSKRFSSIPEIPLF